MRERLYLDIGHVGIFRSLVQPWTSSSDDVEAELFHAMQAKDLPALRELIAQATDADARGVLLLPELYGGPEVSGRRRAQACPPIPRSSGAR